MSAYLTHRRATTIAQKRKSPAEKRPQGLFEIPNAQMANATFPRTIQTRRARQPRADPRLLSGSDIATTQSLAKRQPDGGPTTRNAYDRTIPSHPFDRRSKAPYSNAPDRMHDANRRTSSRQPSPGLARLCLSAAPSRACWRLDLTMLARRGENVYTGPSLLAVAGALATLPELSLQDVAQADAGTGESGAGSHPRWGVLELCTPCGPLPVH